MRRLRIDIISILGLLVMIFLCTNVSARILDAKLLTSKIGWVATETNLYWTITGGAHWKNITPQSVLGGNIASVFFLDTAQGWVLCNRKKGTDTEFNIVYTKDSGVTWSSWPIKLPDKYIKIDENNQKTNPFSGDGWIDFINPIHGWIILEFPISAKMDNSMGIMLRTEDGGKTYKMVADHTQLPTTGHFHFVTTQEGWLAGHIDTNLYVTHNGGNTWQQVSLEPPSQVSSPGAQYGLPIFKDSRNGFLSATFVTGIKIALVIFATHDSGKIWSIDRVLPDLKSIANVYPSTVVDSILITIAVSESERSLTLIKVFPGGKTAETEADALHIKGDMRSFSLSEWWKLSFVTGNQGWISTFDQLLSTTDGGANWTVITPQ